MVLDNQDNWKQEPPEEEPKKECNYCGEPCEKEFCSKECKKAYEND
ncbi:hypothetical protein [Flavobacterium psychrophilum]|uniref:Uncharacterized protein n=1 Tax=Flavobacterium psychrophilum TaxID=96345 RepID=A0A7U2R981_FLAPS|nr:hypothetical protein [Flavobacterium psychrophilum]QRE03546.1 hypothetical protein H0H26_11750 [Flavobacterium psychrophilum]